MSDQETEIVEAEQDLPSKNGSPASGQDPMAILDKAVSNDADIETVEKLIDFQERLEANQARKAFDAAMADMRDDLPKIVKKRTVDYETNKGRTRYDYEDLSDIVEQVSPVLSKHDLSFRWRTDSEETDQVKVTCIISHRDGHSEETTLSAKPDTSGTKNSIQALGSTVTYLQRYTLKAALGVAAGPDDDAQAAGSKSGSSSSNDLTTDPDECDVPNFDGWDEWDVIADLPSSKLVDLKEYLTGDKLKGDYAEENKAMRKAVLEEIKRRKEAAESDNDDDPDDQDDTPSITDAAVDLAREHGIAKHVLQDMDGSGEDGRILKSDIQEYIDNQDDESDDHTEEVNMPTVMDELGELVDETPATLPEVKKTLEKHGYTRENLDGIASFLAEVSDGQREYSTSDGVITFD